jgi:hypothetical protein
MNTAQIQLRLTLSDQLYDFLRGEASRFGMTVTQVVKHMIFEKAQKSEYPTFAASDRVIEKYKEALANKDKFVEVKDVGAYLDNL